MQSVMELGDLVCWDGHGQCVCVECEAMYGLLECWLECFVLGKDWSHVGDECGLMVVQSQCMGWVCGRGVQEVI